MARKQSLGQRSGFEDRLARIKKGGANTMGEIQVGPREEIRARDAKKSRPSNTVRLKRKKQKKEVGRGSTMSLILLAFLFGALSMFVGQVTNFHLFQEGGFLPIDLSGTPVEQYLPFAHLAIGGVLALLFCWTFHLTSVLRLAAAAAGVFLVFEYHTEMVQQAPGVYTKFFSKAYVKEMRQAAGSETPAA